MEERGQETIKEQDWRRGEKKKMEEHNEGRTENMRKSNLQRVEDQSVSEMDSEAESKVWENGEKTQLIRRDFCPNIFWLLIYE